MPKKEDRNKKGYVNTIIENEMRSVGASTPDLRLRNEIDQTEADIQQIVSAIKRKNGQIRQIESNYKLQLQVEEENRLKKNRT